MSDNLQQAVAAIKSGDSENGKRLLIEVLKSNPRSETAWLWMTQVVSSNDERIKCLQQVLDINPNNELAKRGLATLQKQLQQVGTPKSSAELKPIESLRSSPEPLSASPSEPAPMAPLPVKRLSPLS